jgi:PPP family 3-phenylpropionic acid transporter
MSASSPESVTETAPDRFSLRVSAGYFAVSLTHGVSLSFFPIWLAAQGNSSAAVGTILSAQLLFRTLTVPLISARIDKANERAGMLIAITAAALVLSLGFFLPQSFVVSLLFSLAIVPFWGALAPIVDSIAISGQRRYGADFASMRLWGSISFMVASLAAGWAVEHFGAGVVPAMFTATFGIALAVAFTFPRLGPVRRATTAMALPTDGSLLRAPGMLAFFVASALIIGGHGFFYAFASIHYAAIGHSKSEIGLLWAFGVACEIALFAVSRRFITRLSPEAWLALGGLGAALRWLLLPWAPLFSPSPLLADFALQALHAPSFALSYIATQRALTLRFNEQRTGAAIGMTIFLNGLVFAATTFAGGHLYGAFGMNGIHLIAILSLAGVGLAVFSKQRAIAQ